VGRDKINSMTSENIWIFNHYATKPDEPATRAFDFARELILRNHKVTIFASAFSHYKLTTKYLNPNENQKTEMVDGVKFVWVRSFSHKRNNWKRLMNMLSFSWRAYWIGKNVKEKPSIVLGSSVHPFAVITAYLIAKNKKSRFFFEVRDLWPQTLIDMHFLGKNNPLAVILRMIERFLYQRAEKIITLLPYAGNYITTLGINREKIVWIPNGINMKRYENIKPYDGGNPANFVFMYTGIHAKYANLDSVLFAAKIIQDQNRNNIKFIFVGDGSEKKNLIQIAKDMSLANVEFKDMVPKDQVFKMIEQADALISIIMDLPVLKYGISSNKLNDYLASGRPIVCAIKSGNNPVSDSGAGIVIEPGSSEILAKAFLEMVSFTPEKRIEMGQKGIDYIKKNYDIKVLADKMEELFI